MDYRSRIAEATQTTITPSFLPSSLPLNERAFGSFMQNVAAVCLEVANTFITQNPNLNGRDSVGVFAVGVERKVYAHLQSVFTSGVNADMFIQQTYVNYLSGFASFITKVMEAGDDQFGLFVDGDKNPLGYNAIVEVIKPYLQNSLFNVEQEPLFRTGYTYNERPTTPSIYTGQNEETLLNQAIDGITQALQQLNSMLQANVGSRNQVAASASEFAALHEHYCVQFFQVESSRAKRGISSGLRMREFGAYLLIHAIMVQNFIAFPWTGYELNAIYQELERNVLPPVAKILVQKEVELDSLLSEERRKESMPMS
jgi:hypothetical protein